MHISQVDHWKSNHIGQCIKFIRGCVHANFQVIVLSNLEGGLSSCADYYVIMKYYESLPKITVGTSRSYFIAFFVTQLS